MRGNLLLRSLSFMAGLLLIPVAAAAPVEWESRSVGEATGKLNSSPDGIALDGTVKGVAGDAGQFAAVKLAGDQSITVKLVEIQGGKDALTGIFMRPAFQADEPLVFLAKRPGDDWVTMGFRLKAGVTKLQHQSAYLGNGQKFKYLRLVRQGTKFSAFRSADNAVWLKFHEMEIPELSGELYGGVFVSAKDSPVKAKFEEVKVEEKQPDRTIVFKSIPPDSPSLDQFPLRLNKNQRKPVSEQNPFGYLDKAPWIGSYRHVKNPIPELEMVGPDGVVYPDFTSAGREGGIPENLPVIGTIPVQTADFYTAITKMIENAPPEGGVIRLEEGTYRLTRPLIITRDNIVIRGAGRDLLPPAGTGRLYGRDLRHGGDPAVGTGSGVP